MIRVRHCAWRMARVWGNIGSQPGEGIGRAIGTDQADKRVFEGLGAGADIGHVGLKDEAANRKLRELGAIVRPSTPEEFTAALKADEANVAELLKLGLLKPE